MRPSECEVPRLQRVRDATYRSSQWLPEITTRRQIFSLGIVDIPEYPFLRMRPLTDGADDLALYTEWFGIRRKADPVLDEYLHPNTPIIPELFGESRVTVADWLDWQVNNPYEYTKIMVMECKEPDYAKFEPYGHINIHTINLFRGSACINYFNAEPKLRRRGLVRIPVVQTIRLLRDLHFHDLYAFVDYDNESSRKILERHGKIRPMYREVGRGGSARTIDTREPYPIWIKLQEQC